MTPRIGGHTERDTAELVAAGVDPHSTEPREHDVECGHHGCMARTWHQSRGCDQHYVAPFFARLAVSA